jgi:hypothetical protein
LDSGQYATYLHETPRRMISGTSLLLSSRKIAEFYSNLGNNNTGSLKENNFIVDVPQGCTFSKSHSERRTKSANKSTTRHEERWNSKPFSKDVGHEFRKSFPRLGDSQPGNHGYMDHVEFQQALPPSHNVKTQEVSSSEEEFQELHEKHRHDISFALAEGSREGSVRDGETLLTTQSSARIDACDSLLSYDEDDASYHSGLSPWLSRRRQRIDVALAAQQCLIDMGSVLEGIPVPGQTHGKSSGTGNIQQSCKQAAEPPPGAAANMHVVTAQQPRYRGTPGARNPDHVRVLVQAMLIWRSHLRSQDINRALQRKEKLVAVRDDALFAAISQWRWIAKVCKAARQELYAERRTERRSGAKHRDHEVDLELGAGRLDADDDEICDRPAFCGGGQDMHFHYEHEEIDGLHGHRRQQTCEAALLPADDDSVSPAHAHAHKDPWDRDAHAADARPHIHASHAQYHSHEDRKQGTSNVQQRRQRHVWLAANGGQEAAHQQAFVPAGAHHHQQLGLVHVVEHSGKLSAHARHGIAPAPAGSFTSRTLGSPSPSDPPTNGVFDDNRTKAGHAAQAPRGFAQQHHDRKKLQALHRAGVHADKPNSVRSCRHMSDSIPKKSAYDILCAYANLTDNNKAAASECGEGAGVLNVHAAAARSLARHVLTRDTHTRGGYEALDRQSKAKKLRVKAGGVRASSGLVEKRTGASDRGWDSRQHQHDVAGVQHAVRGSSTSDDDAQAGHGCNNQGISGPESACLAPQVCMRTRNDVQKAGWVAGEEHVYKQLALEEDCFVEPQHADAWRQAQGPRDWPQRQKLRGGATKEQTISMEEVRVRQTDKHVGTNTTVEVSGKLRGTREGGYYNLAANRRVPEAKLSLAGTERVVPHVGGSAHGERLRGSVSPVSSSGRSPGVVDLANNADDATRDARITGACAGSVHQAIKGMEAKPDRKQIMEESQAHKSPPGAASCKPHLLEAIDQNKENKASPANGMREASACPRADTSRMSLERTGNVCSCAGEQQVPGFFKQVGSSYVLLL